MINDEYRKIILTKLHEVLKPIGFKKKAHNFLNKQNDVYLIIQLQSSMSSYANHLKVTVNLGVFSTLISQRSPSVWDSHWRQRIGFLTKERFDKWWTITTFEEAEKYGEEISNLAREKAVPLLFSLDSTEKLIQLWEKNEGEEITEGRRKFIEKVKTLIYERKD